MRNQQQGRRRGRGGPRPPQQGGIVRPDAGNNRQGGNRSTGNAAQMLEKYKTLARDATQSGDRITAEYYFQYADHYFRVLNENRPRFEDRQPQQQQRSQQRDWQDRGGADADTDGGYDASQGEDEAAREGYPAEPQTRETGDGERGYRDGGRSGNDRGPRENERDTRPDGERGYRRDGRGEQNRSEQNRGDQNRGEQNRGDQNRGDQYRGDRDGRTDVGGDGRDSRASARAEQQQRDQRPQQRSQQYAPRDGEREPRRERFNGDEARNRSDERGGSEDRAAEPFAGPQPERQTQPADTAETARPRARRPRREDAPAAPSADDPFAVRRSPEAARAAPTRAAEPYPEPIDPAASSSLAEIEPADVASIEEQPAPKRRGRKPRIDPAGDAELSLENA